MRTGPCRGKLALTLATLLAINMLGGLADAQDGGYRIIHDFGQRAHDGWDPIGLPAVAKNGDLYGVTFGGGLYNWGTVFKLTAPQSQSGIWAETKLHDFPSLNQEFPTSLIIGQDGALYGAGGGPSTRGFIFRMTPPSARNRQWIYDVLYTLKSRYDGSAIQGNLVFDAQGNLYGATELGGDAYCEQVGCGNVFELQRPTRRGGKWHFKVLHTFTGKPDGAEPFAGVTFDDKHNLYGTTFRGGRERLGRCLSPEPANGWAPMERVRDLLL